MLAAQADVLVVGPQHHLLSLPEDLAVLVEAGVAGGLLAAPANGLDLLDDVGGGQQLLGAREDGSGSRDGRKSRDHDKSTRSNP